MTTWVVPSRDAQFFLRQSRTEGKTGSCDNRSPREIQIADDFKQRGWVVQAALSQHA
jgi:hypothetical protein